mgnify:FL=1
MNIFYLNKFPMRAAQEHCDKHVVKMILEQAQLLSTAHHELGSEMAPHVYKSTHKNHPSAVWVRSGYSQYTWGYSLLCELLKEYTHRYHKTHATARLLKFLATVPDKIPTGVKWSDPPQCMYDECRTDDTVEAYRNYYKVRRNEIDMRWTNREIPAWL